MNLVLMGNRQALFNNPHALDIYLFGKENGYDWNIAPLRDPEASYGKESLLLAKTIESLADFSGVSVVSAPKPTFANGVVLEQKDLDVETDLLGVTTKLHQGAPADGVVFDSKSDNSEKSALWISSADCPTIIALGKGGCWGVAHCARNSILEGVVVSFIEKLKFRGENISDLVVTVCLGIRSEHFEHRFDHPEYGEHNKQMVNKIIDQIGRKCISGNITLGRVNLFKIIRIQLEKLGIPRRRIYGDKFDTFTDKQNGKYRWWSARRGDKGRNAIFVTPCLL